MMRFALEDRAEQVKCRLEALLTPAERREERRRGERVEFPYRMRVLAASTGRRDQLKPLRSEEYVLGRDLSDFGLGFRHEIALPYRRVLLAAADDRFEELEFGDIRIEVLLRWCRFRKSGYESGGQILNSMLADEALTVSRDYF